MEYTKEQFLKDTRNLKANVFKVPNEYNSLESKIFYKASFDEIILPNSIKRIPVGCFMYSKIKKITIPESAIKIGSAAFSECKCLKEVILPDSVKSIGNFAFEGCIELKEMALPKNLNMISSYVFADSGIKKLILNYNIETIADHAFADMSNLTDINLEDTKVKFINYNAFADCLKLEELTCPKTLKELNYFVIENSGIKKINIATETTCSFFPKNIKINHYNDKSLDDLLNINKSFKQINNIFLNNELEK